MGIMIQESLVNETKGYRVFDSPVYESYHETVKSLFSTLQKLYGRCRSGVFVDGEDGKARKIGWCFEKSVKYEDVNETYLQSAWITLHEKEPVTTTKHYYKDI
jgi:hypothetical protein